MEATSRANVGAARRRVFLGLGAWALGLFLARHLGEDLNAHGWWPWAIALACAAAASLTKGTTCRGAMLLGALVLGFGWFGLRLQSERPSDFWAHTPAGAVVRVEGVVTEPARPLTPRPSLWQDTIPQEPATRLRLRVTAAEDNDVWHPATGELFVRVKGSAAVEAGRIVRVVGTFEPVREPANPGDPPWPLLARQQGLAGTLRLTSPDLIKASPTTPTLSTRWRASWYTWRSHARDRAEAIVRAASGPDTHTQALMLGLLVGQDDPGIDDVRDAITRQGLAHALSISGFHLGVMAWVMLTCLRLTGDRGWLEPCIVALVVALYVAVVPSSAPLVRSAIMVIAVLAAEGLGRRYDRLVILGWVALALLVWRPLDLWSMGFQLSFGLTATLLWLGARANATIWGERLRGVVRPREPSWRVVLREHAQRALSAAALCWVVSIPLVVYHTGQLSTLGIVATLLVTPALAGAMWVGYAALFVGLIDPALAGLASGVLGSLAGAARWAVALLDSVPGSSVPLPPLSTPFTIAASVFILAAIRWGSARRAGWWWGGGALALWLLASWTLGLRLSTGVALRVDTLSVGDGSCHLLRAGPDAMLWDCAPMPPVGPGPALRTACRALGVDRVPTLIITHPDFDHFGGLQGAIEGLGVQEVIVSDRFVRQGTDDPKGHVGVALAWLASKGVHVRTVAAGDSWRLGGTTVRVLSPPPGADWPLDNDHSVVVQIDVPGAVNRSLLLTGDIQDHAIAALRSHTIRADVVEAPHHGSTRAAAVDLVTTLAPALVLQSTGPSRVDRPEWAVSRQASRWLCTATHGSCWVEFLADGRLRAGTQRGLLPGTPRAGGELGLGRHLLAVPHEDDRDLVAHVVLGEHGHP